MPLYSYACQTCGDEFELLVNRADTPVCPKCGGRELTRLVSRIAPEIKYPAMARAWRRAAAQSGDLSNFSAKEQGLKKN